ncbi:hypothetical protein BCU68_09140 [Vibrio sp. 10N.286.49.B3]|uniref:glycosyltransferase family 2 protein n=1 Tax=Vibrio sp. 10N.286.49.B3 TaxID=1880855 RepID=UPI000C82DC2B|nr:glycosyltransferase family 2 protein [Vibrio sp. 10N.286.49.B3]PMH45949.1 hypothetical protein BCU68_09140 [Vibrio sp. 10N.286.49.B3]
MLSVIIVNWNSGAQLKKCVQSLINFGHDIGEIIIVDNNSSDDSMRMLPYSPKIKEIILEKNIGFGQACNVGAQSSSSPYLLFLNPDTYVLENTIKDSVEFLQKDSSIGVLGVKLFDDDKVSRSCARDPSFFSLLSHSTGLSRLIKKTGYHMQEWDHLSSRYVDHVIGAFYMMPKNIFDKLGGFDPRFFVYFEDLDLSKRVKELGFNIFYNANISAYHYGGGTSEGIKSTRLFYSLKSRIKFTDKHCSTLNKYFLIFIYLFVEPLIRVLNSIFKQDLPSVLEVIDAYKVLYEWFFSKG